MRLSWSIHSRLSPQFLLASRRRTLQEIDALAATKQSLEDKLKLAKSLPADHNGDAIDANRHHSRAY